MFATFQEHASCLTSSWLLFPKSSINTYSYPGTLEESPGVAKGEAEAGKWRGGRIDGVMALGRHRRRENLQEGGVKYLQLISPSACV